MGGVRIIRGEGGQCIYEGRSDKKKYKAESVSYQKLKYIKICESLGGGGKSLKNTEKYTEENNPSSFSSCTFIPVLFFN